MRLAGNIVTHSLQVGVAQVLVLAAEPGDLPAQLNALHPVPSLPSLPLHPPIRPPGHAGTNYKENKVVARVWGRLVIGTFRSWFGSLCKIIVKDDPGLILQQPHTPRKSLSASLNKKVSGPFHYLKVHCMRFFV